MSLLLPLLDGLLYSLVSRYTDHAAPVTKPNPTTFGVEVLRLIVQRGELPSQLDRTALSDILAHWEYNHLEYEYALTDGTTTTTTMRMTRVEAEAANELADRPGNPFFWFEVKPAPTPSESLQAAFDSFKRNPASAGAYVNLQQAMLFCQAEQNREQEAFEAALNDRR